MKTLIAAVSASLSMAATGQAQDDDFGVLVMAHGGSEAWNASVETMLAPVAGDHRLELAFGMADAVSLQQAVDRLEERGAERIGVVRIFISGESWHERTRRILGLEPGAPARPQDWQAATGHHGHRMEYWRLESDADFALTTRGLAQAPEMGAVLVERVRAMSEDPENESVLILAHGPGDDAENARWIEWIDARADAVRYAMPVREVRVETLREDWPEARAAAEVRIRDWVAAASQDEGRVLVVPYRLSGFGPYGEVLEGLDYVAEGRGLLPSAAVADWVRRQIAELEAGTFETPVPASGRGEAMDGH
ncbi:hypothetical protein [Maricaulis sp.]|uniref:sirohydrochlorin chelatase n=1 Tax=Maricaulis sp. TaxID=1486257 RepID=UPI0026318133|nr:hypothetical protein [Maricaulis sp.]